MAAMIAMIRWFFRAPPLTGDARRTYRLHLTYALFDALTGGLVATTPVIAKKQMGAPDWQLGLSLTMAGAGMLTALYLSHWMAVRRKMPFVFLPGVMAAVTTGAMAAANNSLLFLLFGGLGLMFSTMTRPAVAAIVRMNYPAEHRGQATGEIRRWSSLVFLLSFLASSALLDHATKQWPGSVMTIVRVLLLAASMTCLVSYLLFKRIQVAENPKELSDGPRPPIMQSFHEAVGILRRDARYRRYVLGCLAFGFSAAAYFPYILAFLEDDLHYNYVQCALLLHVIPAVAAFLATGLLGRWFDRVSLSSGWALVRFGWGIDPLLLAATTAVSPLLGSVVFLVPMVARTARGAVQGGFWILWWQIGVAYYAKPGADTSRYQGILVFVDGVTKMTAPAFGAWVLMSGSSREFLFFLGGVGVMLSGVFSLLQARHERADSHLTTTAEFEAQFDERIP